MMILLIAIFILGAITLLAISILPGIMEKVKAWQEKKEKTVGKEMDKMFYEKGARSLVMLYFILPFALGFATYFFTQSPVLAVPAVLIGLVVPNFIMKIRYNKYRQKFNSQLLDTIQLLSSALKGGMSLLQAFEVVIEEMPAPMKNEIGLVVRENKIGVSFEESLARLNKRMHLEELELIINSILVAKETGGELTKVFSRLIVTIRDNRKLKENITTLTLQGRMQGFIMSALPFLFIGWVITVNPHHFDIMLQNDLGRMLLFIAGGLQVLGIYLIRKFSKINI